MQEVIPLDDGRRHDCERAKNKPSIGIHKPDYLLRNTVSAGEQSIVVVGEMKGMADADRDISDEEVGQILDFIQEVLIKQGWRQVVFGFLTDGVRFGVIIRLSSFAQGYNFCGSRLELPVTAAAAAECRGAGLQGQHRAGLATRRLAGKWCYLFCFRRFFGRRNCLQNLYLWWR